MTRGLGSPAGRFSALLYDSYVQPPAFTLWLDASGDTMGGEFLESEPGFGVWLCFLILTTACAHAVAIKDPRLERSVDTMCLSGWHGCNGVRFRHAVEYTA